MAPPTVAESARTECRTDQGTLGHETPARSPALG